MRIKIKGIGFAEFADCVSYLRGNKKMSNYIDHKIQVLSRMKLKYAYNDESTGSKCSVFAGNKLSNLAKNSTKKISDKPFNRKKITCDSRSDNNISLSYYIYFNCDRAETPDWRDEWDRMEKYSIRKRWGHIYQNKLSKEGKLYRDK